MQLYAVKKMPMPYMEKYRGLVDREVEALYSTGMFQVPRVVRLVGHAISGDCFCIVLE